MVANPRAFRDLDLLFLWCLVEMILSSERVICLRPGYIGVVLLLFLTRTWHRAVLSLLFRRTAYFYSIAITKNMLK
jgi:hypothetical protein